jgi:hypothetical protein
MVRMLRFHGPDAQISCQNQYILWYACSDCIQKCMRMLRLHTEMHTFCGTDAQIPIKNTYISMQKYIPSMVRMLRLVMKCIHSIVRMLRLLVEMHTFYGTDAQIHAGMHTSYSTDAQIPYQNAYILWYGCSDYV